jgi:hypothetical protein
MPVQYRRFVSLLCLSAMALLTACGGSNRTCEEDAEPYLTARDNEALSIPAGLSEPDRSGAMPIPAKPSGKPQQGERTRCLDEPPSYFRSAGTIARSPEEVIASWGQAWANREADAVIELYSATFTPPTDTAGRTAWLEQRREQVATGPIPDSMVENLRVEPDGPDRRVATFVQRFGTNSLRKELTLIREVGSWRIVAERVVDVK